MEAMGDGLDPESLDEQLEYLREQGFNIVGLEKALAYMVGETNLPENLLSITFDGVTQM